MSMNKGELISEIKRYKELFGIISEQKDEILRMLGVLRDASATKAEKQEVEALLRNQNVTDAQIKAIKKGEQQVINQTLATLERKFPQISSEISEILVNRGISKKALASLVDGNDFIGQVEYLNYRKNVTKEISPAKYADEIAQLLNNFDYVTNISHLRRVVTTVEEEFAARAAKEAEEKIAKETGEKSSIFSFSKSKKGATNGFYGLLSKILGSTVVTYGIFYYWGKSELKGTLPELMKFIKDLSSKNGVLSLTGEPLFVELLSFEKTISGSADEYAKSVGLPAENITNINTDVTDIINEESYFSNLSEDELGQFLNRMTTSYDGINFIYFLKKFKEVKGKDFYSWLVSDINGVEGADFSIEEIKTALTRVNSNFTFIYGVSYKTTVDDINQILTIYQNVSNPDTGIENIYYRNNGKGGSDTTEPWKKFEAANGSTLDITNINNQITTFTSDEINKIKKSASDYLDEYWKSMAEKGTLDNLVTKAQDAVGGSGNKDISKTLDENNMYDYVYGKIESEYPKIGDVRIDWKRSIQKNNWPIQENIKGLNKILFELKKKDIVSEVRGGGGSSGGSSGGGNTPKPKFPGPGTVQEFQDWLDINYPTWLNGGKLNKGTGYGNYGGNTQKAFTQYGSAYQNALSSGGTIQKQPPAQDVDKAKEIFDKFNDSVFFYSVNNERMNIEYTQQIGKWIKYFTGKKFNEESSYLGSVLSAYGNMISKYKTDEIIQNEIDTQLPTLQSYLKTLFEGIQIKRSIGLSQILEQISNLVTVNVVNRVPQKQTESDQYKDASNKTIKSVIGGGDEIKKGERSDTIIRIKSAIGYTKDTTPYFTDDFNTFVINYKGTKGMDNTNGNISQDLICSIEQYKKLCSTSSSQKTTAPVKQTQIPIEVKYLNDYATAVGTGTPSEGACKSLFDYYAQQAKNWDLGNKAGQPNTAITAELLTNAKTAVKRCKIGIKKNFYPRDKKYILDKNNPFYIVEFEKESKTPTTTQPTTQTTPTVATNPVDIETGY
jgi:hypothetical protein